MKIRTGFLSYAPGKLIELSGKVIANATGVPVWASLAPMLPPMQALSTTLGTAMTGSGAGHVTIVDSARIALAQALSAFASGANGVTAATDDDRVRLDLPMAKHPERSGAKPAQQIDLLIKPGSTSGEVTGAFKHIGDNILIYQKQYTMGDPNSGFWIDSPDFSNSRRFTIPGLERGKDVWARVRAVNSNGEGPWSDPATTMVN